MVGHVIAECNDAVLVNNDSHVNERDDPVSDLDVECENVLKPEDVCGDRMEANQSYREHKHQFFGHANNYFGIDADMDGD